MAASIVLPHAAYAAGTYTLGPAAVPINLTRFNLSLARGEWVAGVLLTINVDFSRDGGATWNEPPVDGGESYPIGGTYQGGPDLDKNGVPYVSSAIGADLPDPTNPDRQLKARITITGGPLVTIGTLTTS